MAVINALERRHNIKASAYHDWVLADAAVTDALLKGYHRMACYRHLWEAARKRRDEAWKRYYDAI